MLLSEMDIFFSEKDEFYRSVHSVASLKILKGRTNFFFWGGLQWNTRPGPPPLNRHSFLRTLEQMFAAIVRSIVGQHKGVSVSEGDPCYDGADCHSHI